MVIKLQNDDFLLRRDDIVRLEKYGLQFTETWQVVEHFERCIADFFGAPYAVAVDCCTHALEVCLRLDPPTRPLSIPTFTYMSVPMMLDKLAVPYQLNEDQWHKFYHVTDKIIDAAAMWLPKSYITGTQTCVSFQFKKPLPIGRGGMILLDDHGHYQHLQKMVRDGRDRQQTMWVDDVQEVGYHYYMTPEDAARGIYLFQHLKDQPSSYCTWQDYRDLREMSYFADR